MKQKEDHKISFKEFLKLTLALIKKKNNVRRMKNFELNDHMIEQFDSTEVRIPGGGGIGYRYLVKGGLKLNI